MQQLIKSLPCHSHEPYHTHLRIADILLLPDDDNDCGGVEERIGAMNGFRRHRQAEVTCGFECPSPQRVVSRLFRRLKERRRLVPWREGNEKESVDCRTPSLGSWATDEKAGGGDGGSSVGVGKNDESGPSGKENVLNVGVACSLLYLIASSKEELSKMKDLRTDMEMLLQNVKEEVRGRDSAGETSVLKESPAASCLTDLKQVSSCSSLVSCQSTAAPYLFQGEDSITISSQSVVCDEAEKESVEGMGQLEAELEAELERLQLQLDTECFPQSLKITGNDSTAEISGNSSLGEVVDPSEATIQFHGGVPPLELERKLHELLESRQQERIKELEAALESVKQKLSEKEREATWWKDNALLMSHHAPDPRDCSHNRSSESC